MPLLQAIRVVTRRGSNSSMLLHFDFDGVIADSFTSLVRIAITAQEVVGFGRPPTDYDFQTIENLTFEDIGRLIGIPESSIACYSNEAMRLQRSMKQLPQIFPDVVSVFQELATRHVLTVISSSDSSWIDGVLQNYTLRSAVTTILGGESGITKTERIVNATRAHGFDLDKTIMFGDSISDIRQGKMAGVRTAAVLWGFQARHLLEAEEPDFVIERPKDLLRIFPG